MMLAVIWWPQKYPKDKTERHSCQCESLCRLDPGRVSLRLDSNLPRVVDLFDLFHVSDDDLPVIITVLKPSVA